MRIVFKTILSLILVSGVAATCPAAATQQDESKGIQAEEYVKKRPKMRFGPTPSAPLKRRVYKPVKSNVRVTPPRSKKNPPGAEEIAYIGFTIWKFARVSEADDPKILREADPRTQAAVAGRRLESESLLSVGDLVRIGIESGSHEGNLYVINREKYADKTYGKAKLIFPTLSGGTARNFVQPGVLMYFPSAQKFFIIDKGVKAKQAAEELIVIVSPTVLIDPSRLRREYLELTDAEVNGWIGKWDKNTEPMELEDGVGETMTPVEKSAGDQQKSLSLVPSLTQDDALPQTVYRMRIKRGNPVLVRIELKIDPN